MAAADAAWKKPPHTCRPIVIVMRAGLYHISRTACSAGDCAAFFYLLFSFLLLLLFFFFFLLSPRAPNLLIHHTSDMGRSRFVKGTDGEWKVSRSLFHRRVKTMLQKACCNTSRFNKVDFSKLKVFKLGGHGGFNARWPKKWKKADGLQA